MDPDTTKGRWHQLKGKVKERWGKLTDDDMRVIEGNLEQAAGRIQERYGMAKDEANREWDAFRKEVERSL